MKQFFSRILVFLLLNCIFLSMPVLAQPSISAQSAVVLDAENGRVLFEKDSQQHSLIASTTKIMTGLLIAERCNLSSRVSIPEAAIGTEGSSLYLQKGDVFDVRTLLYGMMLHSGNDAAVALAIYCCGSTEEFVTAMNIRAEELGLENTHFANPNGLDDVGNYSTAEDLARLAAAAMENSVFREIVSTKSIRLENKSFTNHNKLLWQYDGAVGIKTGYTKAAGRILVSSAERDGRRLIAVTINDGNDWRDHARLLDYGFSSFSKKCVLQKGQVLGVVPVLSGMAEQAEVVVCEDVFVTLAEDETVTFALDLPAFVFPPVLGGDQAGEICVILNDEIITKVPLYWRASVLERR